MTRGHGQGNSGNSLWIKFRYAFLSIVLGIITAGILVSLLCVWGNKLEGGEGLIQVYTGNGKGKTTAALGLAIRASGAGFNVYIGQFAKGRFYSELASLKKIKRIKVEQFGSRCFIRVKPGKKDIELACEGLKKARKAILGKRYRLVILDEINIALNLKLIGLSVLSLLRSAQKIRLCLPDVMRIQG